MRLPRVRFTVRRMMVAVAVAALLLIGVVLWRRSEEYRRRAESHDSLLWSELPVAVDEAASPGRLGGGLSVVGLLRRAKYHHDMSQKYWRAAARPWLPVAPDPPEPE
jgi:hypothetical protein